MFFCFIIEILISILVKKKTINYEIQTFDKSRLRSSSSEPSSEAESELKISISPELAEKIKNFDKSGLRSTGVRKAI